MDDNIAQSPVSSYHLLTHSRSQLSYHSIITTISAIFLTSQYIDIYNKGTVLTFLLFSQASSTFMMLFVSKRPYQANCLYLFVFICLSKVFNKFSPFMSASYNIMYGLVYI